MENKVLVVTEEEKGKRLDVYLTAALDVSRSYAQQLIQGSDVVVNDKPAKANYRVNTDDVVQVRLEVQEEYNVEPENIPLDVVYEDKDIIVVNKARGMVVHPAAGNFDGTLVNALLYHCQGELSGINGVIRPGIVHRLDKDTSGVMVAAKTDEAHKCLAEQIKAHSAHRTYWALVHGNISEEKGVIDAPIGRHPKDRIRMAVTFKGGRDAVTHFRVLKRYGEYTWVECKLETGRTHQIRVHMAYIHHPVVNDPLYGYKKDDFPIDGQALHSHSLDLVHPITKQLMHFEAPAPADFLDCLKRAEQKE
ncbi:RluA family pseudouridine synthase [uncultured Megasphaera sp.]|uniref:RluA family pseudouridine synthase n=1 Tax=uncultured Megasphaera sp. TaxID=165188 RepID=UPI0025EF6C9B|nr:RluA family pseudouridine synthase [uncultured Megasphaera sp.]